MNVDNMIVWLNLSFLRIQFVRNKYVNEMYMIMVHKNKSNLYLYEMVKVSIHMNDYWNDNVRKQLVHKKFKKNIKTVNISSCGIKNEISSWNSKEKFS